MKKQGPKTRAGTVPIKFRPDRQKWEVTIHHNGKRSRKLYPSETAANKAWSRHCLAVKAHGDNAVSAEEIREFLEARRIVSQKDLRDVARFYLEHHPKGAESILVSEAWERFKAEKETQGLSDRHLETLRYHVQRFVGDYGGLTVRAVSAAHIREHLLSLGLDARTVKNFRGSLANFFNWCKRRELCEVSPTDGIEDADLPAVRPKSKGVLSVDQSAAMMAHIEANHPELVAWHALQLFAGIRRAEVGRMTWDMIDLERETLTLPGWNADGDRIVKTGDDWVLHDLPANLWEWLRAYRGKDGMTIPTAEEIKELRTVTLPKLFKLPKWPSNCLRHTFATMMMSLHGDAAKVATWSRHTNVAQLYRSYVAKLVSRDEAGRFVGIVPNSSMDARHK